MQLEPLVRRARQGDVTAFVELTRSCQQLAFGSALALVHDRQQAEDVVQEAFLAAWSSLPKLADPNAFPGWLRTIVRHQAHRVLRQRRLETVPLDEAPEAASGTLAPDQQLEQQRAAAAALTAIAQLPDPLREPAALFFLHECSHQDIAAFLNVPATTVNNRLHQARTLLQKRIPALTVSSLASQGPQALPDDFATRIGRIVAAGSAVVEVVFDPEAVPSLLSELLVSDEANQRAVPVQVVQRSGDGIVRGLAASTASVPRGATVLSTGQQTRTPVRQMGFARAAALLGAPCAQPEAHGALLETGIKVIDVMCPLTAGGSVVLVGELGAGVMVVMEELVRRLSGGASPLTVFAVVPPYSSPEGACVAQALPLSEVLQREGYSEGTAGPVQTFFLRGQAEPWTAEHLEEFAAADAVIHLSREAAEAKIYPAVQLRTSRSRLIETGAAGAAHRALAAQVREVLGAALWNTGGSSGAPPEPLMRTRARKLQSYFAQPFYAAESFSDRLGTHVGLEEALRTCGDILAGRLDELPEEAFYFVGGMEDIRNAAGTP